MQFCILTALIIHLQDSFFSLPFFHDDVYNFKSVKFYSSLFSLSIFPTKFKVIKKAKKFCLFFLILF